MKKLIAKAKKKLIEFFKWLWAECKDWRTLALLGVVCLVLSLPIWLGYLLGFLFHLEWAFWVSTVLWGFWMLPGAPFFAVAVSVTLAIKKIYEKKQEKKQAQEQADTTSPKENQEKNP